MNELVYNGTDIRRRDDFMCLTDLWKSAGADPSKHPAFWGRQDETAVFIEHIISALNLTRDQVWQTKAGRYGGTYAHWQIGLAYAKYLSPELHAHVNTVYRDAVESGTAPAMPVDSTAPAQFNEAMAEFSLVKQEVARLHEKVDRLKPVIDRVDGNVIHLRESVEQINAKMKGERANFAEATIVVARRVLWAAGGHCLVTLVREGRSVPVRDESLDFHHGNYDRKNKTLWNCIPLTPSAHIACHDDAALNAQVLNDWQALVRLFGPRSAKCFADSPSQLDLI